MIRLILQTLSITGGAKMKTFVIEEKFVGYADITIEAETEEEAEELFEASFALAQMASNHTNVYAQFLSLIHI